MENPKMRMGISACLLGQKVRFDGQHKHDRYLTSTLGQYFEYVPVCPEVECGLPVPREAMHLEGDPAHPRLVTVRTHQDLTEQMLSWARGRVEELAQEQLCGFIFKSDSPSSGMERVKVYGAPGSSPSRNGIGMFARTFMERFPLIPTEEEGRLHDPKLREMFIETVFTLQRWRTMLAEDPTVHGLMQFHATHKYLFMAHSPECLRELGRLVASSNRKNLKDVQRQYEILLVKTLRLKTTVRKNANVLQHMMGYFKELITPREKQELLQVLENYQKGYVPLVVPLTLIAHYVRLYEEPYLAGQVYLQPHPVELALRNQS